MGARCCHVASRTRILQRDMAQEPPKGAGWRKLNCSCLGEFILTANFIPPGLRSSKRSHFLHCCFIDALPPGDPRGTLLFLGSCTNTT